MYRSTSGFVSRGRDPGRRPAVVRRTVVRSRPVGEHDHVERTNLNRKLIGAVRWYQRQAQYRPSPCRFTPTCSCYAVQALEVHGTLRGLLLTLRRLLRCRPFGPSGFDPIPEVPFKKVM